MSQDVGILRCRISQVTLYIQTRICLIILFILNILIDNAEKTCLEAKLDEIVMKQNEAIPKNIRGKKKCLLTVKPVLRGHLWDKEKVAL